MEFILTPEQMRNADSTAIERFGIPSAILMENAARSAFEIILELLDEYHLDEYHDEPNIFIFCGSGNNGGDGFAIARQLNDFVETTVYWLGDESKMSPETKINFQICENIGLKLIHLKTIRDIEEINWKCNIIIDSMIGVGGSENIRGLASDVLDEISKKEALKIAIDAPTGLNTLTGHASDNCFHADLTITMYAKKLGQLLNSGPDVSRFIETANLGAPFSAVIEQSDSYVLDDGDISNFFIQRENQTSKFDYGRLVIIAGCKKYPGAAALAANAAIKSGTGLVELFSEVLHPQLLPEVICYTEHQSNNYWLENIELIRERIRKADAVLIGPGLGVENIEVFGNLLDEFMESKKIILDADGINLIDSNKIYNENLIITPHSGEFAKLTGKSREDVESESYFICKEYAGKLGCIIHLKGSTSISSDGKETFLTTNGNPGMATAGSGDVLAGVISALASQGNDSLIASAVGSYLHAESGRIYRDMFNETSLTASELIKYLPFNPKDDSDEKV